MYGWKEYEADLKSLEDSGAKVFIVGYSVLGRPVYGVFKGSYEGGQILVQACIHAREGATVPLVIKMMREYTASAGVWCLPMVNPDGFMLCDSGLSSVTDADTRAFLLEVNGGSENFSAWKANAQAVDLNVNFPARWGEGSRNVTYPSPSDYIGEYPLSAPESRLLHDFTLKIQPQVTLSYHAKGEVIYKGFGCVDPQPQLAASLGNSTGYGVYDSEGSAGGYKDWFVATTVKPGYTVEVGGAQYTYSQLFDMTDAIYYQNREVLDICAKFVQDIK